MRKDGDGSVTNEVIGVKEGPSSVFQIGFPF